jgi:hypothetical protein
MPPATTDRLKGRPAALARWPGERRDRHRALLLWAMQIPGERSMRAVGRAMGCSEGSVRNWQRSGAWQQRDHGQGADSDLAALDLYRDEYMADFGALDLPHVAGHVSRPLGNTDLRDPSAQAAHEARQRVAQAVPAAAAAAEQAAAQAVRNRRRDVREDAERHIKLVDGAIGVIARKLKADEVRVSVRDIPVLLDCRDRLVHVVSGTAQEGVGVLVVSARVAHAKETGGDVVAAMHEDAMELVAILGALASAGQADLHALAAADSQARAERASA